MTPFFTPKIVTSPLVLYPFVDTPVGVCNPLLLRKLLMFALHGLRNFRHQQMFTMVTNMLNHHGHPSWRLFSKYIFHMQHAIV
mmetsp:Transcript_105656/g.182202  ORF Transcript_105656/g.182202 Transcript_105656/m.182202 type:complete len:83 (-) Transcript_105656:369-617(-)